MAELNIPTALVVEGTTRLHSREVRDLHRVEAFELLPRESS